MSRHPLTAVEPKPDDPTRRGERISSLDFIRGLAVMGIVFANVIAFGQPFTAYVWPGGFVGPDGDPGGWLWIVQFVAIDGKMRGLFTLLFGAGMALFVERARARGANRWLQARRLLWLLAFGLAHYFLLWRGDILTLYALCGLIVLLTLDWEPLVHLSAAIVGYCAGALLWTATFAAMYVAAQAPGGVPENLAASQHGALADGAAETALARSGSWIAMVDHRIAAHGWGWLTALAQVGWETIPLMWLGIALYRFGLFEGRFERRAQARWGWIGLIAGTVATLAIALWVKADGFSYYGTQFAFMGPSLLTRLPAILGLAALLALWGASAGGGWRLRIRAAGRMAFSNYLGTSLVMVAVFSAWGLDLFGQFDRLQLYSVALAMGAAMLAWSAPWLARFRYGPLEWLWRCLTYGRVFAFRR